ncbi:MAG: nucleotide pyrophosphohydrolase [Verrucomicrobia bacterium]|nr:nucleotide pyrophosphohydrolase [Verrucomicrobiota bacterium]
MKDLQPLVAAFVRKNRLETDVAHRLLDAVAELGEVAKEALKGSSYGSARFAPTPAWQDELGDVLFSLICVANTTGVDLDAAVKRALRKYARRLAAKGDAGSSKPKRRPTLRKRIRPARSSL